MLSPRARAGAELEISVAVNEKSGMALVRQECMNLVVREEPLLRVIRLEISRLDTDEFVVPNRSKIVECRDMGLNTRDPFPSHHAIAGPAFGCCAGRYSICARQPLRRA